MSPYPQIATLKLQLNQWYTEAEDHITAKMTADYDFWRHTASASSFGSHHRQNDGGLRLYGLADAIVPVKPRITSPPK